MSRETHRDGGSDERQHRPRSLTVGVEGATEQAALPVLFALNTGTTMTGAGITLRDGDYVETASGAVVELTAPFAVRIDVPDLLA